MKTRVAALSLCSLLGFLSAAEAAPSRAPAEEPPVEVAIAVAPEAIAPGSEAAVTIQLRPKTGIKVNKYPKIKLQIPATQGLVGASEAAVGASAPPPADQLEANYYKDGVEPLIVKLQIDGDASRGRHDVKGKLSYFYCVAASGYCAPAKVDVTIPITVR